MRYTAGINTQARGVSGTRYDQVSFRGFSNVSGVGTNYLDGMRLVGAGYATPQIDTDGLERIKVLQGSASILYGQANPAGLITQLRKLPTETGFHEVGIDGGSYGTTQGATDLSGRPNESGTLLARFTGLLRDADGLVPQTKVRRIVVQPSMTCRPEDANTTTLQGLYQRVPSGGYYDAVPQAGSARDNPLGRMPTDFYDGDPSHENYDHTQYSFGYQAEHRFSDTLTVRQNCRYYRVQADYASVYAGSLRSDVCTLNRGVADAVGNGNTSTVHNQDVLRVDTRPLHHTLLAGIDYLHSNADNIYRANATGGPTLDQLGLYFQDQIKFDRLTVLLGGRNDRAGTDTNNRLARTNTSQHDIAFTGRAGIIYNFDNGIAPYYSYAELFQPSSGTGSSGPPFKPTSGTSHEIGVKYALPGLSSVFTADLSNTTQSNVLTTDPAHLQFSIQSGEVRSRGLELEAHAIPMHGLNVMAAYTYLDAHYTIQSGAFEDFGFGGGARYSGSGQGNSPNTFVVKGTTLFDATAHYDIGRLLPRIQGARVQVNASNLMDRRDVSACFDNDSCWHGPGRLVLASLRYRR